MSVVRDLVDGLQMPNEALIHRNSEFAAWADKISGWGGWGILAELSASISFRYIDHLVPHWFCSVGLLVFAAKSISICCQDSLCPRLNKKGDKICYTVHCKYLNSKSECNDMVISVYSHYPLNPNAKSSDTKCATLSIR